MMRELSFGAQIADSFVKKLKWETAKANDESPGVLPCLCVEERQRYQYCDRDGGKRIDIAEAAEIPTVNRLVPRSPARPMLIKERAWILRFDKQRHSPRTAFEIDGVELHI